MKIQWGTKENMLAISEQPNTSGIVKLHASQDSLTKKRKFYYIENYTCYAEIESHLWFVSLRHT